MPNCFRSIFALFAVLIACAPAQGAFMLDDLLLQSRVQTPEGFGLDAWTELSNPFSGSTQAQWGDSHVETLYDFDWNEGAGTGRFRFESTLAGEGISSGELTSASDSRLLITPAEALTVRVHGEYTYSIPVPGMSARFMFSAMGAASQSLAFEGGRWTNNPLALPTGTIGIDGEFVLTPDESWQLLVLMQNDSYAGSTGATSTGSGFLEITIVPESTSVVLLTLAIPILLRRGRDRPSVVRLA